jgi:hypothetical protein
MDGLKQGMMGGDKQNSRNTFEQLPRSTTSSAASLSGQNLGSVAKFKNSKLFQKFMLKKDIVP